MNSQALEAFNHAIQDATDLLKRFDALNTKPPPPDIEVLKRASLVMALAALETYFENRVVEAVTWLPLSLIAAELEAKRLVLASDETWSVPIEVLRFRQRQKHCGRWRSNNH